MASADRSPFACRRLPKDWVYEPAAECWQDGLILGNGNLGVVGYTPYGLEWTINKGDIFDGRRDLAARGRFGVLTVGGDFDLYLAVASDRDADDPGAEVRKRLDAAVAADATALDEAHRAWWHAFWSRSRVFPAWPLDRPASFTDLAAEGNWLVSASCRGGRVETLTIRRVAMPRQESRETRNRRQNIEQCHTTAGTSIRCGTTTNKKGIPLHETEITRNLRR